MRLSHSRAVLLMVLVTLMWSIAGVVTRHLEAARSFEVTFWRSAFNVLALTVALLAIRGPKLLADMRRGGWPLWVSGLCWMVMYTNFMVAITLTTVATVLITMSIAPLLTALFARLFLHHRLPRRTWVAIAVAGVGIAWMFGQQAFGRTSAGNASMTGALVALGVPIAEGEAVMVGVGVRVAVVLAVAVGLGVGDGGIPVGDGLGVAVGGWVAVDVAVAVGVGDAPNSSIGRKTGAAVGRWVGVAVAVAVAVGVGVVVPVAVAVSVAVAVGLGVRVLVGVGGVPVAVVVGVLSAVGDGVGGSVGVVVVVGVALGVAEGVAVAVLVGVAEGVAVAVLVGVAEGVAVAVLVVVAVAVVVGVRVAVAVGVRDGVGVRVGIWLISTVPAMKSPGTTLLPVLINSGAGLLRKVMSVGRGVGTQVTSNANSSRSPDGKTTPSGLRSSISTSNCPSPLTICKSTSSR